MDTATGILGTNMYAYCVNDPINMWDPTGFAAIYGPMTQAQWQAQQNTTTVRQAAPPTPVVRTDSTVGNIAIPTVLAVGAEAGIRGISYGQAARNFTQNAGQAEGVRYARNGVTQSATPVPSAATAARAAVGVNAAASAVGFAIDTVQDAQTYGLTTDLARATTVNLGVAAVNFGVGVGVAAGIAVLPIPGARAVALGIVVTAGAGWLTGEIGRSIKERWIG
jgi:hypothetical protein